MKKTMLAVFLLAGMAFGQQQRPWLFAFSCLTKSDPLYAQFVSTLQNIDGCGVWGMNWAEIETSQGVYNWAPLDNSPQLAPYHGQMCAGNLPGGAHPCWLVLEMVPVSYNQSNSFTPAYVYSSQWAEQCCGTAPLDYVYCPSYEGDQSPGSEGIANNGDPTGFPVIWQQPFYVAYTQHWLGPLIQHLNQSGLLSQIKYVRFGGSGGEWYPWCVNQLELATSPQTAQQVGAQWAQNAANVFAYIKAQNPKFAVEESVNCGSATGANEQQMCEWFSAPVAAAAVQNGFGIGSNGLQQSDLTARPTSNNWLQNFQQNPTAIIKELETVASSCPEGSEADCTTTENQTGSLQQLLAFAAQNGVTSLELFTKNDILGTYAPAWTGTPTLLEYQNAGYQQAIQGIMSPVQ